MRVQLDLAARRRIAVFFVLWATYLAGRHAGYERAVGELHRTLREGFRGLPRPRRA